MTLDYRIDKGQLYISLFDLFDKEVKLLSYDSTRSKDQENQNARKILIFSVKQTQKIYS